MQFKQQKVFVCFSFLQVPHICITFDISKEKFIYETVSWPLEYDFSITDQIHIYHFTHFVFLYSTETPLTTFTF